MALVPSPGPGGMFAGVGDTFTTLHREMNRLFDDVLRGSSAAGVGQRGGGEGMLLAPRMDVAESDDQLRVQAELPGVSEQDIELALHDDMLTLRAEKKQERQEKREGLHFTERAYGTFQRSLRLPFPAQPEQVHARFENGVLTVTVPKTQVKQRGRRIAIQALDSQQPQPPAPASQGETGVHHPGEQARPADRPGGASPVGT